MRRLRPRGNLTRWHFDAASVAVAMACLSSGARDCPATEPASPLPAAMPAAPDADGAAAATAAAPLPGVAPIVIAARPKLLHRHREATTPPACPPSAPPSGPQPRLLYRHRERAPGDCPPSAAPGGIWTDPFDAAAPQPGDPRLPSILDPSGPDSTTPGQPAVPPAVTDQGANLAIPDDIAARLANLPNGELDQLDDPTFSTPNAQGDGAAPLGSSSRIRLGTICITVPNLNGGPSFTTPDAALLEGVSSSNSQFNDIKVVAANFGSSFALPSVNLGAVPGTGPTSITGTPPPSAPIPPSGATILPVPSPPASFLAAADNAFLTNPALSTGDYPGTTTYNESNSGVVVSGSTQQAFLYYDYYLDSPILLPGYAVGFVKLTENHSPLPRDRVYMNYSYFRNANLYPTRADVNRFMPGIEKTFLDGWTSIELRTPFAATLSNSQSYGTGQGFVNNISEYRDITFGNMSTIFKTMLVERRTWAITGGVQVMLPTAADTELNGQTMFTSQPSPLQAVFVANESVHVMPFVGSVWAPNDRFFNQVLLQFDRDVNGNPAYVNDNQTPGISGRQLNYAGRLFYPTFMYLGLCTGYWLYKDDTQTFTGFSPVLELHVNQAFNEFNPVVRNGWQLGPDLGTVSVTNALVGCNFEWGTRRTLSFGYVTPLGGGVDRFFDGELRAMYNWRFGPQNNLRRAQF